MSNKTFNDVKINVTFTEPEERENLSSPENISTGFGKISKVISDLDETSFTGDAKTVNGHTVEIDVPSDAKFTDTTYSIMQKATSTSNGKSGLVPAPTTNTSSTYYLNAEGKWVSPYVNNVKQITSSSSSYTRVLLCSSEYDDPKDFMGECIGNAKMSNQLYVKPDTGDLFSEGSYNSANGALYSTSAGVPNESKSIPMIIHNDDGLCIGTNLGETFDGKHHIGSTIISTGYNNNSQSSNPTIYVAKPNNDNTNTSLILPMLHVGNYKDFLSTTYLPKTGGTITGPINYNTGSNEVELFNVTDTDDGVSVNFNGNASTSSKIYMHNLSTTSFIENTGNIPISKITSNKYQQLGYDDSLKYAILDGTVIKLGYNKLILGNNTKSGVVGNKYGEIQIYSTEKTYWSISGKNYLSQNQTIYLPEISFAQSKEMQFVVSTYNTAIGSSTNPVYINSKGVATPIESYSGNAATATKLENEITINGIPFDGSESISISKLLYSGAGQFSVEFPDDVDISEYNAFIVQTSHGSFLTYKNNENLTFHSCSFLDQSNMRTIYGSISVSVDEMGAYAMCDRYMFYPEYSSYDNRVVVIDNSTGDTTQYQPIIYAVYGLII